MSRDRVPLAKHMMNETPPDGGRDLIDRLLDLLGSHHPLLTSRPDATRQIAAGGLMRAEALLRGLRCVLDCDRDDLAGVFIRLILECWGVGMYLLLFGDEAAEHVRGYYRKRYDQYLSNLPAEVNAPAPSEGYWDAWPDARREQIFKDICERVEAKLSEDPRGGPVEHSGISSYNVLYTLESAFSIHAGYASFTRYLALSQDESVEHVVAQPSSDTMRDRGEYVGAGYVALLAWYVHDAFGISTNELGDRASAPLTVKCP